MATENQYGYYRDIDLVQVGGFTSTSTFNPNDELNIARELTQGITPFNKFGINQDIDIATVPEDIWTVGGVYTGFPEEVEELTIRSNNVNDNGGGTGARTVRVTNLLDSGFTMMPDIVVTLSGTTQVSLGSQTYSRASRMFVETAGSGETNIGRLTLRHITTTANVFAAIPSGLAQTQQAVYTVPRGYDLYISSETVQMSRLNNQQASANISIRQRPEGGVFKAISNMQITTSQGLSFNGFKKIPELSDFKISVQSVSANGCSISADINGFLVAK